MPRLLKCEDCLTLEVLPDFAGPVHEEQHDGLLARLVDRHQGPLDRWAISHRPPTAPRVREIIMDEPHIGTLMVVDPKDWNDPEKQEAIVRQIWSDHTGYPSEFYAAKDTFSADANACFNRHNRPKDGCIDWHEDSRRLTDKAWRARGIAIGQARDHVYLCEFCPVSAHVTTQKRMQRGAYDK